jgi:hypothetical protein
MCNDDLITRAVEEIAKLAVDCGSTGVIIEESVRHVPVHLCKVLLPPLSCAAHSDQQQLSSETGFLSISSSRRNKQPKP